MISGCDIGIDTVGLVERVRQEVRRQMGGIDRLPLIVIVLLAITLAV